MNEQRLGANISQLLDRMTATLHRRADDLLRSVAAVSFALLWADGRLILTPELKASSIWLSAIHLLVPIYMFWRATLPAAGIGIIVLYAHGIEPNATIMIATQDMFFAAKRHANVADQAHDFRKSLLTVAGMVDPEVAEMKVGDHALYRVDYNGVGLYRSMVAAEIRCHVISFNVTARHPALLEHLVHRLDGDLSFTPAGDVAAPPCAKDYAQGDNVLRKILPVPVGPRFMPIPVRLIVGADGSVKNVHVIRATDDQRRSIETALYHWKFKPYRVEGRASPVETGLVFNFTADNS